MAARAIASNRQRLATGDGLCRGRGLGKGFLVQGFLGQGFLGQGLRSRLAGDERSAQNHNTKNHPHAQYRPSTGLSLFSALYRETGAVNALRRFTITPCRDIS